MKGHDNEVDTRSVSTSGATDTRTDGRGVLAACMEDASTSSETATLAALLRRVEALEARAAPARDPMLEAPSREEVEDQVAEAMGVLREELARAVAGFATRATVERLATQVNGAAGPVGDVPTREEVEDQVAEAMALLREEFSRAVARLATRTPDTRRQVDGVAARAVPTRDAGAGTLAARVEAVEAAQETLSQEVAELADGLTQAIGAWVG